MEIEDIGIEADGLVGVVEQLVVVMVTTILNFTREENWVVLERDHVRWIWSDGCFDIVYMYTTVHCPPHVKDRERQLVIIVYKLDYEKLKL